MKVATVAQQATAQRTLRCSMAYPPIVIAPGTMYTQWWPHDVGEEIRPRQPVSDIAKALLPVC